MDNLSHLALGAAIGVAVLGRRTAPWKAALWGGLCANLPDLDVLIDHGDPIRSMTFHRAGSHSLFYLTLLSPVLTWLICRLSGVAQRFRRWWLATWLVLMSHPLLDVMTVYGTQLLLPFTDQPFGVGSIFIIDPLFTLPVLLGVLLTLRPARPGWHWNALGLGMAALYLAWGAVAQQWVRVIAQRAAVAQGIPAGRLLVQPTALNTVLWRALVMTPDGYAEGFYSVLDREPSLRFDRYPVDGSLFRGLARDWAVARLAWFSRGFFALKMRDDDVLMSDLRMGQEPQYAFTFRVARRGPAGLETVPPEQVAYEPDISRALAWIGRRAVDRRVPRLRTSSAAAAPD